MKRKKRVPNTTGSEKKRKKRRGRNRIKGGKTWVRIVDAGRREGRMQRETLSL